MSTENTVENIAVGDADEPKKKFARLERVFMEVDHYDTPADGFAFAVGHAINNPEQKLRVRLNTVSERVEDMPNAQQAGVQSQYVSGTNTRESLADKAKANIKFIAFDGAKFLGEEEGVKTFRAHWPNTISPNPNIEFVSGMGSIVLRDSDTEAQKRAQARIDIVKSSQLVNKENAKDVFLSAMSIKDDQGRARDPFIVMRLRAPNPQKDGQMQMVGSARLYPARTEKSQFDQNIGENVTIRVPADSDMTLDNLLSGVPAYTTDANKVADMARAVMTGLLGMEEPVFNTIKTSETSGYLDKVRELHYATKAGAVEVEVVSMEQIDFGKDSAKTYLANKNQFHLRAYEMTFENSGKVSTANGFAPTMVAIQRHADGEPFAVYASPMAMSPYVKMLNKINLKPEAAPVLALGAEAVAEGSEPASPQDEQAPVYQQDQDADGPAW